MAELLFDRESHSYTVDGVRYPSVTEVVAPLGQDYDDDPQYEDKIDAAAERGVVCHAILEQLLAGDAEIEYPSAYAGYIDAIELFLAEHTIIPCAIETPIHSENIGVAGTPDLLCEFDGVLSIIDYKFVSQLAKTKVKAQLNGYRAIYNEYNVFPEMLYAVQFLPSGKYRLYKVEHGDMEFVDCLNIYRVKNRKHPRGIIV